jgi:hypothetical protein
VLLHIADFSNDLSRPAQEGGPSVFGCSQSHAYVSGGFQTLTEGKPALRRRTPEYVPLKELDGYIFYHYKIDNKTIDRVIYPSIEAKKIFYRILSNDEDKNNVSPDGRGFFSYLDALEYVADIEKIGGFRNIDWDSGTIGGRLIEIQWLSVVEFVESNKNLLGLTSTDDRSLSDDVVQPDPQETQPTGSTIVAETQCENWLVSVLQSGDEKYRKKLDYELAAPQRFRGLSKAGFKRAWKNSLARAGRTDLSDPGRKSRI